jgi:NAD(P)H-dependent FMN reductase
MRLLAICGSLRAASSNRSALEAARLLLAPAGVEVLPYHGLGELPYFNPDLDSEQAPATPAAVAALRRLVGECDGILISSPEYAHGVPGSLKNALDWLVSCAEFPGKPVALINTAPRAVHAQAALAETLRTMSARLVEAAGLSLPLTGRSLDGAAIAADAELARMLAAGLEVLVREIRGGAD